jgi:hypothetical protein
MGRCPTPVARPRKPGEIRARRAAERTRARRNGAVVASGALRQFLPGDAGPGPERRRNTGACKSAITFIDGDEGILRYRGYPIEQLAEKSTFLEVGYLLIYGTAALRRPSSRLPHAF